MVSRQTVSGPDDIVAAFALDAAPVRGRIARLGPGALDPILPWGEVIKVKYSIAARNGSGNTKYPPVTPHTNNSPKIQIPTALCRSNISRFQPTPARTTIARRFVVMNRCRCEHPRRETENHDACGRFGPDCAA